MEIKDKLLKELTKSYWEMVHAHNSGKNDLIIKNTRLRDIKEFMDDINKLNFISNIPNDIKPLLSPYGTFYDRYNFYYDPSKLNSYSGNSLAQIICCEIFNVWQCYFTSKTLSSSTASRIQGISILMMYHIGLVKEKMWYGQMIRNQLMDLIQTHYPNNNIISFRPNKQACSYLHNKMIFDDPQQILATHKTEHITVDIIQVTIKPASCFITQGSGWNSKYHGLKERQVFLEKLPNGKLKKVNFNCKKVKEHKELVNLTEKLIGGI